MRPIYLYLPVCVLGIPLLVGLLVASGQSDLPPADSNLQLQNQVAKLDEELEKRGNPLPDAAGMAQLARTDPIAFLENCIRFYDRDVQGYHLIMQKQERLPPNPKVPIEKRKLQKKEVIEVDFKDKPHSVFMHWLEGERLADRCLFVEGENDNMILVHPAGLPGKFVSFVKRKVDGSDAQESGRYTLNMFGIKQGTLRTLTFAKKAKEAGTLNMDYLGADADWHPCGPDAKVSLGEQRIAQASNRTCYVLRRHYAEEENDGVLELKIFVDKQNWLQVGSIVEGKVEEPNGKRYLIGEYYFRDIELNPKFAPDQFKEAAVSRK